MATGNTGVQEGVTGVPHPNLYPNPGVLRTHRYTQIYKHIDTPLTRMGTDPLHPSQGLENKVLLKDAAETSCHMVRDLTVVVGYKSCVDLTQETQSVT